MVGFQSSNQHKRQSEDEDRRNNDDNDIIESSVFQKNEIVLVVDVDVKDKEVELQVVDLRLSMKGSKRHKRIPLKFVKEGDHQKQAHIQQNSARLSLLHSEIENIIKQTGISDAGKLALVTPDIEKSAPLPWKLPRIEWWDKDLLQQNSYDDILSMDQRYASNIITRLIEHPIHLKVHNDTLVSPPLKVYLTKKERKKLRRQNRREIIEEEAEKFVMVSDSSFWTLRYEGQFVMASSLWTVRYAD
uniref:Pre-mRNA-splicing factor 3 domain-containing protein n=1 Tax=Panagrolaimus sp. ES5 TaxID=591445 RepID=A0AC34GAR2_9BILA